MTLPLAAELLLLALDDKTGRPRVQSSTLNMMVAAATLVDLTLSGHLAVEDSQEKARRRRFVATHSTPTDPLLAEVVGAVAGKKPGAAVMTLANSFTGRLHTRGWELRSQLLQSLIGAGLLREVQDSALGIFPITRWLPGDPTVENEIVARVRAAVDAPYLPDQRTAALVGLAHSGGILPKVLPDVDRKALKKRGKELAEGEWAPQGLKEALQTAAAAAGATAAGAL